MVSVINLKSIVIIIILLVILSGIIILATKQSTPPSPLQPPIQSIQPTSYPNLAPPSISPSASIDTTFNSYSPGYLKQEEEVVKQEQKISNQALIVSKFTEKLPIIGQYIKLTYNIYNNQIYLEYAQANKQQALDELVKVLKENQIENINWLYNLKIIEK